MYPRNQTKTSSRLYFIKKILKHEKILRSHFMFLSNILE